MKKYITLIQNYRLIKNVIVQKENWFTTLHYAIILWRENAPK